LPKLTEDATGIFLKLTLTLKYTDRITHTQPHFQENEQNLSRHPTPNTVEHNP